MEWMTKDACFFFFWRYGAATLAGESKSRSEQLSFRNRSGEE